MSIINMVGLAGIIGCIVIDTLLIIDLKMTLNLEKKLTTNTIEYETACHELYRLRREKYTTKDEKYDGI